MRYHVALLCTGLWSICVNASTLHVEAFGDSLTAGFLSDTQVTSPPPLTEISNIITDMTTAFRLRNRSILGKYHAPTLAWPHQLVDELKKQNADVQLYNYAVSGNRSYDLLNQVKKSTQVGKTIAFFFIGHNDLCDEYDSVDSLKLNYKLGVIDALKEWARRHKNSTAFVIPVGKVDEVFKLLQGYKWKRGKNYDYTCEQNWDRYFPYCRSHYKKLQAGTLDKFLKDRIAAMNISLEDIVLERQKDDPKNTYTLLADTHNANYERDHFAVDCYHLSGDGQKSLADRVVEETVKATGTALF
jgi:hypothetical protein